MPFNPVTDDLRRVYRERREEIEVLDEKEHISAREVIDDTRRLATVQNFPDGSELFSGMPSSFSDPFSSLSDPSPEMEDDVLIGIIEAELSEGIGADADAQPTNRDLAWNYYLAKPRGDEKEGRSKIISTDLADMVEAMLAQILPAFTTDLFVEFEADSPQDEETIEEESAYVNWVVQQKNNGFTLFYSLFKDALLSKNCVAKVTTEERINTDIVTYDNIPRQAIQQVVVQIQQNLIQQGIDINTLKYGEDISIILDEEPDSPLVSIKVTVHQKKKEVCIDPIPVERAVVNADHNCISLTKARFAAHRDILTTSDLLQMGIDPDIVEQLPTCTTADDAATIRRNQTTQEGEIAETNDESTRPIEVYDIIMLIDFDQDGFAEQRRILYSSNNILINEEVDHSSFASGTAFIQPFRWLGLSLYDKLKQVQDSKTDFLRQAHDNAKTANNARIGYVNGQVNPDDIFNSKPGGGIRMRRKDSIVPIQTPNVLPAIFEMLGYMDKVRTERAGAALDMQSQQLQVPSDTAHGVERLVSAKEQLSALVSRTLAETVVRDIYLLVHEEARRNMSHPVSFKHDGTWRTANPANWPRRDRVSLTVGLSQGERMRQAQALGLVVQQQNEQREKGQDGVLIDNNGVYRALTDFAKMVGLANPAQYWINPQSPQAKQAAQMKMKQAMERQQAMKKQQDQLIQLQEGMVAMQEETKRLKAMLDRQTNQEKIFEDRRQHTEDTATDLLELELEHEQELNKQREQNVKQPESGD